jgi:predicted ATPase/DNA-binding SARP family transcriptional activator
MPESTIPPLRMRLFGMFDVLCAGAPLPRLRGQKVKWLLALLALRHGSHIDRGWLAAMLWPEDDRPRNSLNTSVNDLRTALGPEAYRLSGTPQTLCLDLSGADIDVIIFDAAIKSKDLLTLQEAVTLYTRPLLEECFEPWVVEERDQRQDDYIRALEILAHKALEDGDHKGAVLWLKKAVAVDVLQQHLHRLLMQTLAKDGAYTAALEVYFDLRARLCVHAKRDYDIELDPDPATTEVYRQIWQRARELAAQSATGQANRPEKDIPRFSVPRPLTALVGQQHELATVMTRVLADRVVTLTGPGGVGKTRLAQEIAFVIAPNFVHGVCLVSLETLIDPELIAQEVATTLGIGKSSAQTWDQALLTFLRKRQFLLILDNCEHLVKGCAQLVRRLLQQCPGLHLLCTSRMGLGLIGEILWSVPPLAIPDENTPTDPQQWLEYPAIRLFFDRARDVNGDFAPSSTDFAAIARICRYLDGLPLAVELAAPLVRALSVQDIAARLTNNRFQLLAAGDCSVAPRHQSLKSVLDWSYGLLTPAEQALLCCLCVFSGGWTLSGAEAVYFARQGNRDQVLPLLTRLIAQSLVYSMPDQVIKRFVMLETTRAYGIECVVDAADWQEIRKAHCEYFVGLAEEGEANLLGTGQVEWLGRLERDHSNFRAALTWATGEAGEPSLAHRLGGALWRFWYSRSYLDEGRKWLERILEIGGEPSVTARLKVVQALANLCYGQGDHSAARLHFEDSLRLSLSLEDLRSQASAQASLANIELVTGNYPDARRLFIQSLDLFEKTSDVRGTALTLSNLAILAGLSEQDYAAAHDLQLRGLSMFRQLDAKYSIAQECCNIAYAMIKLRDSKSDGWTFNETDNPYPYLEEALLFSQTLESPRLLAHCLSNYRLLAVMKGEMRRAAILMGAEVALREDLKVTMPTTVAESYVSHEERIRISLGDAGWESCLLQGRTMTHGQMFAFAGERSE